MNFLRVQFPIVILLALLAGNRAADSPFVQETESYVQDEVDSLATVDYRLPKTVLPRFYDILLMPTLAGDFSFFGNVKINAIVQEATNSVTVHCGRLDIAIATVMRKDIPLNILSTTHDQDTEKYEIVLKETLKKGDDIWIIFEFNGVLRDDMIGFYRSSYVDANGKIKWIAATQFQTTHARHAFPCFDEPGIKATFEITIFSPPGYTSLSNMPLKSTMNEEDGSCPKYLFPKGFAELNIPLPWSSGAYHTFEQSIPMSTYLVAFIVSDFDYLENGNFKVWARPRAIAQANYALDIGRKGLDYLSGLFKQEYQIPKMDMVALPDFSAGAMENWGLITYRETRMLYDEATSSSVAKQSVASVIVHELTHMWFGNLVTPAWWSYLWLSEAFARYYQYFGTAQIETSWSMEDQFLVEQHQSAYAADGLETSQPMTRIVSTPSQIGGIGDTITYNKGASIVRMMHLTLGSDVFIEGLRSYLADNKKTGVAEPSNLWAALQHQVNLRGSKLGAEVKEIMTTWTAQPGYPVVHVSIANGVATLQQERFLLRNLKSTPTDSTWWVPITWTSDRNADFQKINVKHWLSKKVDKIDVPIDAKWVVFNVQSAGFYRVNYDRDSWYRIINVLDSEDYQKIGVLNRAAIVDDLFNLARAGLLEYETVLEASRYLKRETNYLPFKAAFTGLAYLNKRFAGHDRYHSQFKTYVDKLIKGLYDELGYVDRPSDDRLTILLRGELNKWACELDNPGCVNYFTDAFRKWRKDSFRFIHPNQQAVAYCASIKHGTKNDWEYLWDRYFNSNSAAEQSIIIEALGCSTDKAVLEKYLLYALDKFENSRIRRQDSSNVFSSVYNSGLFGAEYILEFVEKHRAKMVEYNGYGGISSILSSASQRFSTQQLVDKFERLIEKHAEEFKSIKESLKNSLEIAKYELLWYNRNAGKIAEWIQSFNDEPDTRPIPDDGKKNTSDTTDYRLPANIIPTSYRIILTPYFEPKFTFDGIVEIIAEVAISSKTIVLHSTEMEYSYVFVETKNDELLNLKYTIDEKYDFLVVELEKELIVGETITIQVGYTGHLNDGMRGFYRSSYEINGETRWLAATHLEPVGARKMFPCFDEPALKATFTIEVDVPKGYHAISNMPVLQSRVINEKEYVVFKETPRMSTYLVAVVVSDFRSVQDYVTPYAVWARPNAIHNGGYSQSLMEPLIKAYESSLGLPYQLPKLDMVALPDFSSGAMENWGLLTFKEKNLLYDRVESPITSKQSITNVISHEITHQWFGNLVSPLWWKYLWLNEGFARYFQYFGTAKVKTDWGLESQFVVDHLHSALTKDSSSSTHAMTHDVYSPTEIRAIFDTISYAKSASVIRMMEKTYGTDVFYKALHNYLKKLEYDVATPEDLFDAFQAEIKDPKLKSTIHAVMDTWTTQPGCPVVHVTISSNIAYLEQERFYTKKSNSVSPPTIWHIPITWRSIVRPDTDNTAPKYWLTEAKDSVRLEYDPNDVTIFNVLQSGYYRVNYNSEHWQRIIEILKSPDFQKIHEINRASLIDDLMNLGRAGYVDYTIVLSATQYLITDTSYVPWRAFFNGLSYLHQQLEGKDAFAAYKRYAIGIVSPMYRFINSREPGTESHETLLLKKLINEWACKLEIEECVSDALERFDRYLTIGNKLLPDNRAVVYCTGIKRSGPRDWMLLWNRYLQTTMTTEKLVILESLACTTDTYYLEDLLNKAVTKDSGIRYQDSSSVFSSVYAASPVGVETVMKFIKGNYEKMLEYYGDVSDVKSIVSGLSKKVSTQALYNKYNDFISWLEEKEPSIERSLQSYKSNADYELDWVRKYVPVIHEWTDKNYPDNTQYRLPSLYTAMRYNVFLMPYFEESPFMFNGRVQIELKREMDQSSRIVLNTHELQINKCTVHERKSSLVKGRELGIISTRENSITQTLSIYTNEIIESEYIIVDIEFTGHLNEDMKGFYRSYYLDDERQIRWLATTQFEPTNARMAFPCLDEPAQKATFIINIETPDNYHALSNMPPEKSYPSEVENRTWITFQETPKMSPYLVAFVISDFERVRMNYDQVNVWGRPVLAPHGDYAQIASMRMLEYLASETGINYTLPKLDLVGIPDFSMGAMENWGLATFREYGLFYHPNVTSARYTDYIITIIAHELSHMWYGNLVTCEWWDYIWLNEGFAEYMQWIISDLFRPGHQFNDLFVVNELHPALQNDAEASTHPMTNRVLKPSDIANIFDKITYGKSASVIRMLSNSLEPGIFERAMQLYLKKHQYKTTNPKDLWNAFDETIQKTLDFKGWGISMETVMDSWTKKSGYPVVHVTLKDGVLTLSQKRFIVGKPLETTKDFYWTPITMTSASTLDFNTTSTDLWLGKEPLSIAVNNTNDWHIVNIKQSGFYRVNYDDALRSRLIDALRNGNHSLIHVANRAQIIDDLFNLAFADHIRYEHFLDASLYLIKETEYLPWKAFFNGIGVISRRIEGHPLRKNLGKYVTALTRHMYKQLGFEDWSTDSHLEKLSRELILNWVCKYDNKDCIDQSKSLFANFRKDSSKSVSPNARPAVYCTTLRNGYKKDFDFLWEQYLVEEFSSEQKAMLEAFGCTQNKKLLNTFIREIFTANYTSNVRKQDVSAALSSIYTSGEFGVNVFLSFLIDNYDTVYEYYGEWKSVGALFKKVAPYISTTKQINQLRAFLQKNEKKLEEIASDLFASFSIANENLSWYTKHGDDLNAWFTVAIKYLNGGSSNIAANGLVMSLSLIISMTVFFSLR